MIRITGSAAPRTAMGDITIVTQVPEPLLAGPNKPQLVSVDQADRQTGARQLVPTQQL
ncbi:MAG: hypothetical protein JWQ13_1534 [Ramlibacter sp.]|jgi:hypothetical protein|nr:hypothetical protein [Ramlibacter sp.]